MLKTGRVYKIIAIEGSECYVGSTFNTTRDRWQDHKYKYGTGKNECSVIYLFDKYGVDGCKMVLIKEYKVVDRRHLEVFETLWIKKLKAINKNEPFGASIRALSNKYKNKWYHNNKEHYQKYREENKEIILEKKKQYREENKEIIMQKSREYNEKNRSIIKQRNKEHYERNKEINGSRRKEKIKCECGVLIARGGISGHIKTKKHISVMAKTI